MFSSVNFFYNLCFFSEYFSSYLVIVFLVLLVSSTVYTPLSGNHFKKFIGHFSKKVFLTLLTFLLFWFILKIYTDLHVGYNFYVFVGLQPCLTFSSHFSDTLVCLSILTSFISWVYLSERYMSRSDYNIFYFLIFIVCTVQMTSSYDLFRMFIYFEFLFLPSLYFVYIFGYSKKVDITVNFLLKWTLSGSFLVLLGICSLYQVTGSLDIIIISSYKFTNAELFFYFFIFFIGFGVKLPIWPLYYWLTKVHVEAPTGFSIFLSGFLVKTAFFCLVFFIYILNNTVYVTVSLGIILWGSIDASVRMWTSTDIKRLIAFATIQEMNLIFLFLFLLSTGNYRVLNCFLLVHGLLSSFLFFLVDQVQKQFNSRNLILLGGLSLFVPIISFFIWVAILIFRGFPAFVKFLIEWELLTSLMVNFGFFGFFLFFLIGFFGVIGFCRVWLLALYGSSKRVLKKDMLKQDLTLAAFISTTLFGLNNFFYFF